MKRLERERIHHKEGLSGVLYATVMKPDYVGQSAWA